MRPSRNPDYQCGAAIGEASLAIFFTFFPFLFGAAAACRCRATPKNCCDFLECLGRLPLPGRQDEREATGLEEGGVQGEGADDGALAGLTAAVEQQLAVTAEHVGLPLVE